MDVTKLLNDWIRSVPNGSTLEFGISTAAGFLPGCYRADGMVHVSHRHDLTFEGNGSTIRRFVPGPEYKSWPTVRLLGGTGIVLRGFTIIGADPTPGDNDNWEWEAESGVLIHDTAGVLIEDVHISRTGGDFITMGRHFSGPAVRDVTVRGGNHWGAGRQGIAIVDGINVTIEGGRYEKIAATTFDLEPCGPCGDVIEDITVRGTTAACVGNLYLAAHGEEDPPKDNVLIEDNVLEGEPGDRHPCGPGSDWPTIDVGGAGSWTIRGNDFARYRQIAFTFSGPTVAVVECNRVRWITNMEDRDIGVAINGGPTAIRWNRFVGADDGAWTGDPPPYGFFVEGNSLEDGPMPPECGAAA